MKTEIKSTLYPGLEDLGALISLASSGSIFHRFHSACKIPNKDGGSKVYSSAYLGKKISRLKDIKSLVDCRKWVNGEDWEEMNSKF